MKDKLEILNTEKTPDTNHLFLGIETLIEKTGRNAAVYLNTEINRLYWSIGNHIITEMGFETYSQQGRQILATLSQALTEKFGKGYTYSGLNRMIKVAEAYSEEKFATLSLLKTLPKGCFINKCASSKIGVCAHYGKKKIQCCLNVQPLPPSLMTKLCKYYKRPITQT